MADWDRPLDPDEERLVDRIATLAFQLYDGELFQHRSCGIAMAEAFGRPTPAYQALRRGGLSGRGPCGVVLGARLILGELLGSPDPAAPTTEVLRAAMEDFDARLPETLRHATCAELTEPLGVFTGPKRHRACATLTRDVARLLAEVLVRHGLAPLL